MPRDCRLLLMRCLAADIPDRVPSNVLCAAESHCQILVQQKAFKAKAGAPPRSWQAALISCGEHHRAAISGGNLPCLCTNTLALGNCASKSVKRVKKSSLSHRSVIFPALNSCCATVSTMLQAHTYRMRWEQHSNCCTFAQTSRNLCIPCNGRSHRVKLLFLQQIVLHDVPLCPILLELFPSQHAFDKGLPPPMCHRINQILHASKPLSQRHCLARNHSRANL